MLTHLIGLGAMATVALLFLGAWILDLYLKGRGQ
jgi:hypothetical protein